MGPIVDTDAAEQFSKGSWERGRGVEKPIGENAREWSRERIRWA